jgi:hypothetical protein
VPHAKARSQLEEEAAAIQQKDGTVIHNPRVLCVTSQQYLEMGLANELQRVLEAFPGELEHAIIRSSSELHDTLNSHQVDVVHIAAFVCPRSGTLYFSRIGLPLGNSRMRARKRQSRAAPR